MKTHREKEYDKRLKIAAKALEKKPLTSTQLAKKLGCSKPTAYSLIQELLRRDFTMEMRVTRGGARGPQAHNFLITQWGDLGD